jgi:hypothetical protein
MDEFIDALRYLPRNTINVYLAELRDEEKIELVGNPKVSIGKCRAYWQLKLNRSINRSSTGHQ